MLRTWKIKEDIMCVDDRSGMTGGIESWSQIMCLYLTKIRNTKRATFSVIFLYSSIISGISSINSANTTNTRRLLHQNTKTATLWKKETIFVFDGDVVEWSHWWMMKEANEDGTLYGQVVGLFNRIWEEIGKSCVWKLTYSHCIFSNDWVGPLLHFPSPSVDGTVQEWILSS